MEKGENAMKTIVYESQTGHTARYAKLLSEKIHLPCCSLEEAEQKLPKHASIIFMSWVEGGKLQKWKQVHRRFRVGAVLAVGITKIDDHSRRKLKRDNHIPEEIPLFQLLGGIDLNKLKGAKKLVFIMTAKAMATATPKNEEDRQIFTAIQNGGDFVQPERLTEFVSWYFNQYC